MHYGYFDDRNREYVITNPKTPVKWINYIGTLSFGGFLDHTGGALICKGDPAQNRITKYLPQLPASSFNGETLYVRLRYGNETAVYSPFFVPTLGALDLYECRVGLGYSKFVSECHGIRIEITVFVPVGRSVEVRDIQVTNISDQKIEVDLVPVVEYTHPDALKQFTNADWVPQTMQSKVVQGQDGGIILIQYPFMLRDLNINYFTSNFPVSSFETDRGKFLGENEYHTWQEPLALTKAELGDYEALRGNNIGALMHHLGPLKPAQCMRVVTLLGQEKDLQAAMPVINHFADPKHVDKSLDELSAYWDGYLDVMQVETPDAAMNSMLNVFNPRQCYITRNWSRYLSLYQLGLGARGIGFRDSSQDVMAVVSQTPMEAKQLMEKLLRMQKVDGSAMHQFNPLTMVGNEGDSRESEDRPHYYCDDHLWIVQSVAAYLKETGDLAFVEQEFPFYNPRDPEKPLEAATVLDHLQRAVAFTHGDCGQHGLPLLGFADWNDTINLPPGAESAIAAALYGRALQELIALERLLGDGETARMHEDWYAEMKGVFNREAWDGDWFISYYDEKGTPIGSHINEAGQLYAYGQAWPVISGLADDTHAESALKAVFERLNTANGIKLSTPGFNGFDPQKGGITTYPPGAKENGGIFLHVNPWVIIAETMLGHGDRAFIYYSQINPAGKNECIEEYESEPYVYPQNILGDEHPQFGLARNSWLSGTASWMYQAATQYILGIQPTYEGLRIDPCIPAAWDGFTVKRCYRGVKYDIRVENPGHVSSDVTKIIFDGKAIEGLVLPIYETNTQHIVTVTLG